MTTNEDPKSETLDVEVQDTPTAVDDQKPEEFDEARAMELIRKQPPMNSERFWQQVEKAKALSPNVEPSSNGPSEDSEKLVAAPV